MYGGSCSPSSSSGVLICFCKCACFPTARSERVQGDWESFLSFPFFPQDAFWNKKLSPASPGLLSRRKASGAIFCLRINILPDLPKPKSLAPESHDLEPSCVLHANPILDLKFSTAPFVMSSWKSQAGERRRKRHRGCSLQSPRRNFVATLLRISLLILHLGP